MSKTFICSRCGREHPVSEQRAFDGQELCQNCYDTETCLCDHCGNRIWAADSCGDENYSLCRDCEDRYYGRCSDCGRLVLRENLRHLIGAAGDESYCEACFDRLLHKPDEEQEPIQRYWYKPRPIFYGKGSRYLGVELEVDEGGESNEEARRLLDVANRSFDHIYIKHDGSLTNGFEIVTHPMTLAYHQTEMPWKELLQAAISRGYLSHQAGTCGLHIHVNRSSLGGFDYEREETIANILYLVENFWNEFLRFSRRTQEQLDHWAARYGRKDNPKDVLQTAKSQTDRYTCVNLTPTETIEFRIFCGTLKYSTLIATLQMVEFICDVALTMSDEEITALTWCRFVSLLSEDTTPELIRYLKERRLYVNEPVDAEREV